MEKIYHIQDPTARIKRTWCGRRLSVSGDNVIYREETEGPPEVVGVSFRLCKQCAREREQLAKLRREGLVV